VLSKASLGNQANTFAQRNYFILYDLPEENQNPFFISCYYADIR
jgi:hypothetical protein